MAGHRSYAKINSAVSIEQELGGSYFQGAIDKNAHYSDPVSEDHRKLENSAMFAMMDKEFIKMHEEAENGFRDYSKREQERIIHERKRQIRQYTTFGSLFPHEKVKLLGELEEKVEKIYNPFNIKWARTSQEEQATPAQLYPSLS